MRNWTGLMLFLIGAWFVYAGLVQRRRARAARQQAIVRGESAEDVTTHPSLMMLGNTFPTIIIAGLLWLGLKAVLMYALLAGNRVFSLLDLAGFLFLLTAYGTWLIMKTRYREVRTINAPVAAPANVAHMAAPNSAVMARGDTASEQAAPARPARTAQ